MLAAILCGASFPEQVNEFPVEIVFDSVTEGNDKELRETLVILLRQLG
jgi:hypothetical protein